MFSVKRSLYSYSHLLHDAGAADEGVPAGEMGVVKERLDIYTDTTGKARVNTLLPLSLSRSLFSLIQS